MKRVRFKHPFRKTLKKTVKNQVHLEKQVPCQNWVKPLWVNYEQFSKYQNPLYIQEPCYKNLANINKTRYPFLKNKLDTLLIKPITLSKTFYSLTNKNTRYMKTFSEKSGSNACLCRTGWMLFNQTKRLFHHLCNVTSICRLLFHHT